MHYAISDIHGHYDKYQTMLQKLDLKAEDTLYVLGDVIDRGSDSFKMLLDIAARSNVVCLLGNHEAMALEALPVLLKAMAQGKEELSREEGRAVGRWFQNGGKATMEEFLALDNEQTAVAWGYLQKMPLYKEVEAGGRHFVLVHGGLEHFSPTKSLADYTRDEIVWCRPETDMTYYPDKLVILGHTPVQFLWAAQRVNRSRIYRTDTWIDIDCGCISQTGALGCLCLDTLEEFYV